jgi:hypothetical protein
LAEIPDIEAKVEECKQMVYLIHQPRHGNGMPRCVLLPWWFSCKRVVVLLGHAGKDVGELVGGHLTRGRALTAAGLGRLARHVAVALVKLVVAAVLYY